MKRFLQVVEQKPLALSLLALIVSLPVVSLLCLPTYSGPPMQLGFDWGAVAICFIALGIALFALLSLIRAEKRGYSSTKIGLSVTALFFAFAPILLFALKLLALYRRS